MVWYDIKKQSSKTKQTPTFLLSTFLMYKPSKKQIENETPKSITTLERYKSMFDNGEGLSSVLLRVYFDDSVKGNEKMNTFIQDNKDHPLFEFIHFVAKSYQYTDEETNIKHHPAYLSSMMRLHPLFHWEHGASMVCVVDIFHMYNSKKYWDIVNAFRKTKETFGAMTSKFVIPERGAIVPNVNDTRKPNGRWLLSSFIFAKNNLPSDYFDNAMTYLENSILDKMRYIDALRGSLRLNTEQRASFQFLENFEKGIDEVFINEVVNTLEENNTIQVKVYPYKPYSTQQTYFDIVRQYTAYMRWNKNKTQVYDSVRKYLPDDLKFKGDVPMYFKKLYKNSEKPIQELIKVLKPKKVVIDIYKKLQMDLRLIHLIETYKANDENIDDFTKIFNNDTQ